MPCNNSIRTYIVHNFFQYSTPCKMHRGRETFKLKQPFWPFTFLCLLFQTIIMIINIRLRHVILMLYIQICCAHFTMFIGFVVVALESELVQIVMDSQFPLLHSNQQVPECAQCIGLKHFLNFKIVYSFYALTTLKYVYCFYLLYCSMNV